MPKSRDPSPGSQDEMETEEFITLPDILTVPDQVEPELNPEEDIALPTPLSSELQVRARAQEDRLDILRGIVKDLQVAVTEDAKEVKSSEPQIVRTTIEEVHKDFRDEHEALSMLWPLAHRDHSYFKEKLSLSERRVVISAYELLAQLERKLSPPQPTQNASLLPPIPLPTFDGDYSKWYEFKSTFSFLIRDCAELSDLVRLLYLKQAVTDSAAQVIAHVPITHEGFHQSWDLLVSRFENKRLILQSLMNRLHNLEPMTEAKARPLMKMYGIIGETKHTLKMLELEDQHNCFLVSHLIRLLDSDTRTRWAMSLENDEEVTTLEQLSKFLWTHSIVLEHLEQYSDTRATETTQSWSAQATPTRSRPAKAGYRASRKRRA